MWLRVRPACTAKRADLFKNPTQSCSSLVASHCDWWSGVQRSWEVTKLTKQELKEQRTLLEKQWPPFSIKEPLWWINIFTHQSLRFDEILKWRRKAFSVQNKAIARSMRLCHLCHRWWFTGGQMAPSCHNVIYVTMFYTNDTFNFRTVL